MTAGSELRSKLENVHISQSLGLRVKTFYLSFSVPEKQTQFE